MGVVRALWSYGGGCESIMELWGVGVVRALWSYGGGCESIMELWGGGVVRALWSYGEVRCCAGVFAFEGSGE